MTKITHLKLFCTALFILTLTACSNIPAPTPAQNQLLTWPQRHAQLTAINHWNVQGLIGVRTPDNKGGSANVDWQQNNLNYQIHLYGPLGAGNTLLQGDANSANLQNADGKKFTAASAELLMQQQLGWHVPVTPLYYWVRGLPAPHGKPAMAYDAYHHLIQLKQSGWIINYLNYAAVQGIDLPTKLELINNNLRVKLIIKRWQLN